MKRVAAIVVSLVVGGAQAQDAASFPNRPLRLIVPYSPGGVTDITARIVAPRMGEALGQQILVENRPGGASIPGSDAVAKAKPDGYTLLLNSSALAANPILFAKLPFDASKDFAPVALVSTVPAVLVVNPSLPARSVQELIALAKAKQGKLDYGSAGNGSGNHLTTEVFKHAAGIDAQHIPYKGGGAVMTDLVGGQISFVFAILPTALPFIQSGKLRALAVTSAKRNSALPEVPAVAESGLPGFEVNDWVGIFAPASTPSAVTDRVNAAINAALRHPEVIERLKSLGADIAGGPSAAMEKHFGTEVARWARLARDVKFEVAQ